MTPPSHPELRIRIPIRRTIKIKSTRTKGGAVLMKFSNFMSFDVSFEVWDEKTLDNLEEAITEARALIRSRKARPKR